MSVQARQSQTPGPRPAGSEETEDKGTKNPRNPRSETTWGYGDFCAGHGKENLSWGAPPMHLLKPL